MQRLAQLVQARNQIDDEIAAVIGRPAQPGHLGEFIASRVFGIGLERSAVQAGFDGRFAGGPFAGNTVDIKWYGKREGLLDINEAHVPDFYLVLAGPKSDETSSRGGTRPWLIEEVFLFDAPELVKEQKARGVKLGVASSVPNRYWEAARIYPPSHGAPFRISEEQVKLLALFGGP
jgi:hypothetical protein